LERQTEIRRCFADSFWNRAIGLAIGGERHGRRQRSIPNAEDAIAVNRQLIPEEKVTTQEQRCQGRGAR
jgi:hypothetical protein